MPPKIKRFMYPMKIEEITGQRIITSIKEADDDSPQTELFVKNVPTDADEEELIPFFEQVGPLHTLRLMMNEKKTENRGYVYITYLRNTDSRLAISFLNGKEIRKFRTISVELSLNNCRIFIGGIPVNKSKDQVWQELTKQGVQDIVDVIMYRSYNNRAENRGFVFVEFPTHQLAARMRCRNKDLTLWGNKVIVDWSVPQPDISAEIMSQVKIIYLRNLSVMEPREELKRIIELYVDPKDVQKLYKFKNYAFVHLSSRRLAEDLLRNLQDHYRHTHVEVSFAKPPNNYTQPEYRRSQMSKTSTSVPRKQSSEAFSVPSRSISKPSSIDDNNNYLNFCVPILSFAKPNLMNSYHYPGITSIAPFLGDQFTNCYDSNIMSNRMQPRVRSPAVQEYFWFGDSLELPRTRSRHDSAVSDLTECCPSNVLRDYNSMLEEALGTKKNL